MVNQCVITVAIKLESPVPTVLSISVKVGKKVQLDDMMVVVGSWRLTGMGVQGERR